MEIRYELAAPEDDAAIRRMLASSPVPGRVSVTYEREPSYFAGCAVMGRCQTLLGRLPSGGLAGLACRAARPLWVNGRAELVGYLGQLRVDPRLRGHGLTARGFHALRELHEADPLPGYLAAITTENAAALRLLVERPQPHLPRFRPLADVQTLALVLRRSTRPPRSAAGWAAQDDLVEVSAFLERHGPSRQCFPALRLADAHGTETLRGLAVRDVAVLRRAGEIAGVLALWDQSGFKQTVVRSYHGPLRALRPLYNLGAAVRGQQRLPAPGQPLRSIYGSFVCVAGDDPAFFAELLRLAVWRAAERGFGYLLLGFASDDPLLGVARRHRHIVYHSRLYTASWEGGGFHERLAGRLPYIDIATL